jgi:hypothetical protein
MTLLCALHDSPTACFVSKLRAANHARSSPRCARSRMRQGSAGTPAALSTRSQHSRMSPSASRGTGETLATEEHRKAPLQPPRRSTPANRPRTWRRNTVPWTARPRHGDLSPLLPATHLPPGMVDLPKLPRCCLPPWRRWRFLLGARWILLAKATSTLVSSVLPWRENLALREWPTFFGDAKMSSALLERLTPHCEILDAGTRTGVDKNSPPPAMRCATPTAPRIASGRIRCLKKGMPFGHDRGLPLNVD